MSNLLTKLERLLPTPVKEDMEYLIEKQDIPSSVPVLKPESGSIPLQHVKVQYLTRLVFKNIMMHNVEVDLLKLSC